jgi:hypothetical protein
MLSTSAPTSPNPSPASPSASTAPAAPEPYTPPRCAVPDFPPIRAGGRGAGGILRAAIRRRRRALTAVLAVTSFALAVSAAHGTSPQRVPAAPRGPAAAVVRDKKPGDRLVRAPVRIADTAAVALLHPGARVDVLAGARVVAAGVTVVALPLNPSPPQAGLAVTDGGGPGGALVVLSVPRRTAAALSGAAATSPLGVALC